MSEQTKHTQLPWHAWARGIGYELHEGPVDVCDGGCLEININPKSTFKQADAEFIVRAVSSHDDLLAACEGLLDFFDNTGPATACESDCNCWGCRARAAIAKAKGVA